MCEKGGGNLQETRLTSGPIPGLDEVHNRPPHEYILALQVAVDDVLLMEVLQGPGRLHERRLQGGHLHARSTPSVVVQEVVERACTTTLAAGEGAYRAVRARRRAPVVAGTRR